MPPLILGMRFAPPSPRRNPAALRLQLQRTIAASGAEVAVAHRTLDGHSELFIAADESFHAASTMKVPVMIELFARAKAGELSLSDLHPVRNEFRSIADGSPYRLGEAEDSDRDVYAATGGALTLQALCEAMIRVSSNLATNLLIERLGVEHIQATVTRLAAEGVQVMRGVEDGKAFDRGLNNSTTARGLLTLLERLARGEAVDAAADARMIDILKAQPRTGAIPAGVPAGTPVAHKTGNITRIHHDAAIVYGPRPYVLVVLVRGLVDPKASGAVIAELSRTVYASASHTLPPQP